MSGLPKWERKPERSKVAITSVGIRHDTDKFLA